MGSGVEFLGHLAWHDFVRCPVDEEEGAGRNQFHRFPGVHSPSNEKGWQDPREGPSENALFKGVGGRRSVGGERGFQDNGLYGGFLDRDRRGDRGPEGLPKDSHGPCGMGEGPSHAGLSILQGVLPAGATFGRAITLIVKNEHVETPLNQKVTGREMVGHIREVSMEMDDGSLGGARRRKVQS